MSRRDILWLTCLILGVALFAFGVITQTSHIYLLLIIPVIETSSPIALIGVSFIFLSMFLYFLTRLNKLKHDKRHSRNGPGMKTSGVVFIGPIPIVFSNDKNFTRLLLILLISVVIGVVIIISIFLYF